MAYSKKFNPDALPPHASPDEAAQAMSHLHIHQNPKASSPVGGNLPPNHAPPTKVPQVQQQAPRHRPNAIQTGPPTAYNGHGGNNQYHGQQNLFSPPPPTGYGTGPRPHPPPGRSPAGLRQDGPRTPAPLDPDAADLYPLFRAANASGTGSLTTHELGSALVNADFTPFDPQTTRSLMRMFSNSPPNQPQGPTITYAEFQNLWRFLTAWRELFEKFDEDRSGRISLGEFSNALSAFGYRLTMPFIGVLYNTYGGLGSDRRPSNGLSSRGMSFDLFVQACISLKRMTDIFKGYDDDRDGYVTLSFEEFLTEMLRLRD